MDSLAEDDLSVNKEYLMSLSDFLFRVYILEEGKIVNEKIDSSSQLTQVTHDSAAPERVKSAFFPTWIVFQDSAAEEVNKSLCVI
jgi:hypothetical protein